MVKRHRFATLEDAQKARRAVDRAAGLPRECTIVNPPPGFKRLTREQAIAEFEAGRNPVGWTMTTARIEKKANADEWALRASAKVERAAFTRAGAAKRLRGDVVGEHVELPPADEVEWPQDVKERPPVRATRTTRKR